MRILGVQLLLAVLSSAAVLDRVAVAVGGNVITEGEVLDELRLEKFLASQALDLSPQQRRAAAERLIDQQLIRQEMEVGHYRQPDAGKADEMLDNFRRHQFRSVGEFRSALQQYGLTEDQVKQYLLWQLTVIEFTDERFHANIQKAPEPSPEPSPEPAPPGSPGAAAEPSADRQESETRTQSADRGAPGAPNAAGGNDVDQQLDAWLKEARASVRVEFKKEAFQ